MKPDVMSLRGTVLRATSGTTSRATSERFAMIPWEIGTAEGLTDRDVRVYFVLASCRRGATVSVGTRWIGEVIHAGRNRVAASIRRLEISGYVVRENVSRGKRPIYQLTAPLFAKEKVARGKKEKDRSRPTVRSAARMWAEDNAHREVS